MNLKEILENSTYTIFPDMYSVAKVSSEFECKNVFTISKDSLETTAIYKMGTASTGIIEEKQNYKLIAVNVAVPFYAPGFIATISSSMADRGIAVLVVSTYSRDYFIVASKDIRVAMCEMEKIGLKELKELKEKNNGAI